MYYNWIQTKIKQKNKVWNNQRKASEEIFGISTRNFIKNIKSKKWTTKTTACINPENKAEISRLFYKGEYGSQPSCIFYRSFSFYESIKELTPEQQVQIYDAIFKYEFDNEEVELTGVCKSIFTLIIPQLEANNKRYTNGCKGGRPKK